MNWLTAIAAWLALALGIYLAHKTGYVPFDLWEGEH